MKKTTLLGIITLGGPGSGCNGPNCGRPSGSGGVSDKSGKGFAVPKGVQLVGFKDSGDRVSAKVTIKGGRGQASYTIIADKSGKGGSWVVHDSDKIFSPEKFSSKAEAIKGMRSYLDKIVGARQPKEPGVGGPNFL